MLSVVDDVGCDPVALSSVFDYSRGCFAAEPRNSQEIHQISDLYWIP